jgi:hypothetical protein
MSQRTRDQRLGKLERKPKTDGQNDDGPVLHYFQYDAPSGYAYNVRIRRTPASDGTIGGALTLLFGRRNMGEACLDGSRRLLPTDRQDFLDCLAEARQGNENAASALLDMRIDRGHALAARSVHKLVGRKSTLAYLGFLKDHDAELQARIDQMREYRREEVKKRRRLLRQTERAMRARLEAQERTARETAQKADDAPREDTPPKAKPKKKPLRIPEGGKKDEPPTRDNGLLALNGPGRERVFGGLFDEPNYQPEYFWNAPSERGGR